MSNLFQIDLEFLPGKFVPNARMSDDAFEQMCRNNDLIQFERTREGEILMNPATGGSTGSGNSEINWQLVSWLNSHGRGRAFDSSTGFHLPDGSMLSPDASYVSPQRLKGKSLRGFPRLCPDFIIELLSKPADLKKTQAKMALWLENGALLAWLIDPYKRRVTIYRPAVKPVSVSKSVIVGEGPVEGLTLDLKRVWACYEL